MFLHHLPEWTKQIDFLSSFEMVLSHLFWLRCTECIFNIQHNLTRKNHLVGIMHSWIHLHRPMIICAVLWSFGPYELFWVQLVSIYLAPPPHVSYVFFSIFSLYNHMDKPDFHCPSALKLCYKEWGEISFLSLYNMHFIAFFFKTTSHQSLPGPDWSASMPLFLWEAQNILALLNTHTQTHLWPGIFLGIFLLNC